MKKAKSLKQTGFTIVELLIAIIVIGIIATIISVSYNGVQNRAQDVSVQSDLKNIAHEFDIFYGRNARYPNSAAELDTLEISVSKASYAISPTVSYNLIPCVTAGSSEFAIIATSKSGKRLYIYQDHLQEYTGAVSWSGAYSDAMCTSTGLASSVAIGLGAGYTSASSWRTWTN